MRQHDADSGANAFNALSSQQPLTAHHPLLDLSTRQIQPVSDHLRSPAEPSTFRTSLFDLIRSNGVLSTANFLGTPFGVSLSNMLFSSFRPSVSDPANFMADTPAFRQEVP